LIIAALAVGMIARGHLIAAYCGMIAVPIVLALIDQLLAPLPPHEGEFLGGISAVALIVGWTIGVPLLLWAGGWVARGRGRDSNRWLVGIVGVLGIGAVVIAFATLAGLGTSPAARAFEVSAPAGWTILAQPGHRVSGDPAYGWDYAAVDAGDSRPSPGGPLDHAILGVSVARGPTPPFCERGFRGWPGSASAMFTGAIASSGTRTIAGQPASWEIRTDGRTGSMLYIYGVPRTRVFALATESLCYAVVLTVPPGSPLTAADAEAVIASFRFR
jgi:hypothetical protein